MGAFREVGLFLASEQLCGSRAILLLLSKYVISQKHDHGYFCRRKIQLKVPDNQIQIEVKVDEALFSKSSPGDGASPLVPRR